MCNLVFLSTDSPEDLATNSSEDLDLTFTKATLEDLQQIHRNLAHENVWFLSHFGGCSCHFRHVIAGNVQFDFRDPQDWDDEDEDDIQATVAVYKVIKGLVENGFSVDIIDFENEPPEEFIELEVDLGQVPQSAFRFFENYRFNFR